MSSEAAARPQVSVVVPTRDRPRALAACLAALEAQTAPSFEVVVVDDCSVDRGEVAAVVAAASHARLVRGEGRGPAVARNLGAREAAAPVICFTDDDCRPEAIWLEAMLAAIQAGAGAVAGPTCNGRPQSACATASQEITNHLRDASLDPESGTVGFAPTSNVACRADVHAAVPFDESFPLAAGEDREWCDRLAAQGHPLRFEPKAVVWHHQDLSLTTFWRQQHRYGRGAHHWRQRTADRAHLQPAGFYTDLVRRGFALGPATGALVVLAQLATASGLAREAISARC